MIVTLINLFFTLLFVGGAVYFWRQTAKLKKPTAAPNLGFSLVSIAVPKNNERTPLAAEQMFAALHGIFRRDATTQPQVSFEVISKNHAITFFVYMPNELKEFVLSQIYAQYPTVDIKEVDLANDYAQLDNNQKMAATEMTLKRPTVHPIKTFQNFEVDPLSGITGVLSSVSDNEEIWTQLIIRPVEDDWQEQGEKEIKNINQQKKLLGVRELAKNEVKALAKDFFTGLVVGAPPKPPEKKDEKKDDKKEPTGPQQQAIKGIEEKITKLGFEVTLRLVAAAADEYTAKARLEQAVGAYKQFNTINMNALVAKDIVTDPIALNLYRQRVIGQPEMIFNITELASLYHFPAKTVETPTIAWAGSKKGEPPVNLPIVGSIPAEELTLLGVTNYRNRVTKFGIKRNDRRLHTYVIGKTGTGKSTLLENMIHDDIQEGRGLAVVDPHGQLVDHILKFIPEHRIQDVVYFNAADHDFPLGFNVLENKNLTSESKVILTSGVVGVFEKIFGEVSWGPRLEYILRNVILGLLDYPNATMLGIMRVLTDNAYRRLVISEIKDPTVKAFFIDEYEKYDPKFRQEAIAPIQNKVGQFLSSSLVRNIVGQPNSTIKIDDIMNNGKILLADFSKGRIGEDNSALLGSLLVTQIQLTSMARSDIPEAERRDFYLYVDEFQNFATSSFATILSEARKYRLNLIMAHQYVAQLPEAVRDAVFGNIGTTITFRINAADAEALQKEFEPVFDVNDLVNLDNYNVYLKMAIDGVTAPAFSAATLPPPTTEFDFVDQIKETSRQNYARPRADVEDYIAEWSVPINLSEEPKRPGNPGAKGRGLASDQIVSVEASKPPASPVTDTESKPVTSLKVGESAVSISAVKNFDKLNNHKIEVIRDRFNRHWYAMTQAHEAGESQSKNELSMNESATDLPVLVPASNKSLAIEQLREEAIEPVKTASSAGPSRGEAGEKSANEPLISWEKASELGLKLEQSGAESKPAQTDDLLPIDEL